MGVAKTADPFKASIRLWGTDRQSPIQASGVVDSGAFVRAVASMQSAQEWRFLVRHLYLELGKPPVAGYSADHVHAVLWGDAPPDSRFFRSLLDALTSRGRQAAEEEEYGLDPGALADNGFPDEDGPKPGWVGNYTGGGRAPAGTRTVLTLPSWLDRGSAPDMTGIPMHRIGPVESADEPCPPGDAAAAFAPPNPEFAETPEQFTETLNMLKRWSGLTLRELEQRSKANLGAWMPRATAGDLLRRKTLPKEDTLAAFTAACGLTRSQQWQWEAVRSRLETREKTREATEAAA